MGYRSDVTIRCEEKAKDLFKEAWSKVDFAPDVIGMSGEVGNETYTLNWEWVKWYGEFEEVDAIMDVCKSLDGNNEDGYAYKLIEIGEDYATEERCNDRGNEVFADFYVVASVNLSAECNKKEERLKTLLYNAISMLVGETYERYCDEDRKTEWFDMMTKELGCSLSELQEYGGIEIKVCKGE